MHGHGLLYSGGEQFGAEAVSLPERRREERTRTRINDLVVLFLYLVAHEGLTAVNQVVK
jgi:hypothetical protein